MKKFLSKNIAFLTVLTMTNKKTKVVETLKFDYADFGDCALDIYLNLLLHITERVPNICKAPFLCISINQISTSINLRDK